MNKKNILILTITAIIGMIAVIIIVGVSNMKTQEPLNICVETTTAAKTYTASDFTVNDLYHISVGGKNELINEYITKETYEKEIIKTEVQSENNFYEHTLPIKRYINAPAVNIRVKPSLEAEIIGQVYLCDEIDVLEDTLTAEWATICYNGQYLYISNEFLSEEMPVIEENIVEHEEEEISFIYPIYSVAGNVLSEELQRYAYDRCCAYGIEWYYPYLICQMYQESRFNQWAISPNGDYGLMQLNIRWHETFKNIAGHPEYDVINNAYNNIDCGVAYMAYCLAQNNYDLYCGMSMYNTGECGLYQPYINQVMQWYPLLQKIN